MASVPTLNPSGITGRINSIDVIRGVSLLGISLMNITGFGLFNAYSDPTVTGGATGWNFVVWWITNMFFEGTMRGMFSMLFGAGVILFMNRSTESIQGVSIADLYFRRLLWLFAFGVIHCYLLLWPGEILYCYALVGMFAYSFRHLKPRHLVIIVVFLLSVSAARNVKDYFHTKKSFDKATAAHVKKDKGASLTKDDKAAIEDWDGQVADMKPSQEKIDEDKAARKKGYISNVLHMIPVNQFMETVFIYRFNFLDTIAMMLLGMALLKTGILNAAKTYRYYLIMGAVGYSIGLTTNYLETDYIVSHDFGIVAMSLTGITYDVGRVFTTLGHIAVIMMFIKSGFLLFLQRSLAAVGQMAFTNYIMQTIICNTVLLGFGFALYGELQRYQLYYIVFGIWVFQLIASPLWMTYFRFGPLEWVWRSLTYWQRQPFRKAHG